jgi:hypothetical protein
VGIDAQGNLSGLEILYYRESYKSIRGDFLNTERFPNQFEGKSVAEGFRVGRDVDGVSRATISSWAVARGVRNAAREVAQAYLSEAAIFKNASAEAQALSIVAPLSWDELIQLGLVQPWSVGLPDGSQLELTLAFLANEGLGEILVGSEDFSRAEREASNRVRSGSLLMVGIGGDASEPFRQENLALKQGDWTYQLERRRFVYVGSAEEGKSRDKMRFAGAVVLPPQLEIDKPFTVFYNTGVQVDRIEDLAQAEVQIHPPCLGAGYWVGHPGGIHPAARRRVRRSRERQRAAGAPKQCPSVGVSGLNNSAGSGLHRLPAQERNAALGGAEQHSGVSRLHKRHFPLGLAHY